VICYDNSTAQKIAIDMVEFHRIHPRLLKVVFRMDEILHEYGKHAVITSFLRKKGVHATGRGIDLRSRGLSARRCKLIEATIIAEFPRKDRFFTCKYHDTGKGLHFHLQVPATVRRQGGNRG